MASATESRAYEGRTRKKEAEMLLEADGSEFQGGKTTGLLRFIISAGSATASFWPVPHQLAYAVLL